MREVYLQDLWASARAGDNVRSGIAITTFPCVVGRHRDCDYRIDNPLISRRHCAFSLRGDEVCVEDVGSRNGTFINGKAVLGLEPLHDGNLLHLASLSYRVRLPAQPTAPVVEPEATGRAAASAAQPRHVLVVEDNPDAAAALAHLLTAWGHEVQVAHDGSEALEVAQSHPPDTVLLDICLPGMDGYQVARRLREEVGLEKTRLVGITGYEPDDRDWSRAMGLTGLLTKPVAPEVLQEVISQPN
jgi:CheY-like chemotaxis protein